MHKIDCFEVLCYIIGESSAENGINQMKQSNLLKRITINPDIAHGKPCIRNLRYPVEFLLELLSSGMSQQDILADYEDLEPEDIRAFLVFATRLCQVKRIQSALE